ncbi:MAG: TetR/AcrR family transcriptional regulator [Microlunatus sp.]
MPTSAPRTARAIARRELTEAIVTSARRQLAEIGPAALSVRAVARDLGMASSAVYRYFPSRDDLLTELLVIIYGELADLLEAADADCPHDDLRGRWFTLGRTLRGWAIATPHEYALLFGSPVPGYAAPEATIQPAGRVAGVLIALMADAEARSTLPERAPLPTKTKELYAGLRAASGIDLSDEAAVRALTAWSGLFGALSLELFGHLHRAIEDYAAHFELILDRLDPTS